MRSLSLVLICFLLTISFVGQAKADYFVWRDAVSNLTVTFPDTWKILNNQQSDTVLTAMAPSGRGHAQCVVRTRVDERYMIYPSRFSEAIQKVDFSLPFWEKYLGQYENAELYSVQNAAGLGRGFAGYAIAGYDSAVPGPYMKRKGLMFASLYNGDVYILECSSHKDAFADWKTLFLSIADSVDFKKAHHQFTTGHYRRFLDDPGIEFRDYNNNNVVVY